MLITINTVNVCLDGNRRSILQEVLTPDYKGKNALESVLKWYYSKIVIYSWYILLKTRPILVSFLTLLVIKKSFCPTFF